MRLDAVRQILFSIVSVILALGVGALIIKAAGLDVRVAYGNLWAGAFGDTYSISETLVNSVPLILTGLSVVIALRAGLFNIGAEGQMIAGALAAAAVAVLPIPGPPWFATIAALLCGALTGAIWAWIAGVLRAKNGAHEVITTIMLNYIATLMTSLLVKSYLKAPGPVNQTVLIPAGVRLPELIAGTRLTWALPLAIVVVAVIHVLFKRTRLGFELDSLGENPSAAAYAGVHVDRSIQVAMMISGAVAGLAGSTVVLAILFRFITNFSPGYGFMGISVALVALNHPWAVLPAALLFAALQTGGVSMQLFARIPSDLVTVIQALVIIFAAAPALFSIFGRLGSLFNRFAKAQSDATTAPKG